MCLDLCLPLTPNGCDCFGCCTFPEMEGAGDDGSDGYVWIGHMDDPGCQLDNVTEPAACPPCTPDPSCLNGCGYCEICVGKPTIPDDCFPTVTIDGGVLPDGGPVPDAGITIDSGTLPDGGTPPPRCPPELQACGLPGDPPCPRGTYCITGCCMVVVE
jgi:hypothetical protein